MIDNNINNKLIKAERPAGDCLEDDVGRLHPPEELSEPTVAGDVIIFAINRAQYLKAITAYKEAESFLKITEFSSLNKGLYIPSINELRYYGYHLNRACESKNEQEQFEELKRAERHCQRASFDALELALLGTLKSIQNFNDDYSTAVVTDVIRDYPALLVEVEEIKEFVASKSSDDRTEHYQECAEKLKRLKAVSLQLESSRSSLNSKINEIETTRHHNEQTRAHNEKIRRYQIIGIIFVAIGGLWVFGNFCFNVANANTNPPTKQSLPSSTRGRLDSPP